MSPIAYACYNKDETIRQSSSSGGVFYLLAKWTIAQGGVVCGAKFDQNWEVVHACAETLSDAMAFMTSKYVQSDTGDVFRQVKTYLQADRYVLFSGTPCQVAGLQSYLGKTFEKLITVDFVCHGVPSRRVWRDYLQLRAKGRTITQVNFRDKTEGWLKFSLKIDYADGHSYQKTQQEDLFIKGFLQDIYLRPSCYHCRFKGIVRGSDITLADLWGCQRVMPALFDDKGTSFVLIQSNTGKRIWDQIALDLESDPLEIEDYARTNNPNILKSVSKNHKIQAYQNNPTWKNLQRLTRASYKQRIKRILRKCKHLLLGRRG